MQNRYTGDIGDYFKYTLLRQVCRGRKLGVAWYLYPDEFHNSDGKHINYFAEDDVWRNYDPELFDLLKSLVMNSRRNVHAVEQSNILGPSTVYSGQILNFPEKSPAKRKKWRSAWFNNVLDDVKDCDVVFADPDNGLCNDAKFKPAQEKHCKRLPLYETRQLSQDRTAIIYHHNTRFKGGHDKEVAYWLSQIWGNTIALRFKPYSPRTFFVINPNANMVNQLEDVASKWRGNAKLLR